VEEVKGDLYFIKIHSFMIQFVSSNQKNPYIFLFGEKMDEAYVSVAQRRQLARGA
jgi:hypothetical protein